MARRRIVLLVLGAVALGACAVSVVAMLLKTRAERDFARAQVEALETEVRELQKRPPIHSRLLDDPSIGDYDRPWKTGARRDTPFNPPTKPHSTDNPPCACAPGDPLCSCP
jgi:hypothetical protein